MMYTYITCASIHNSIIIIAVSSYIYIPGGQVCCSWPCPRLVLVVTTLLPQHIKRVRTVPQHHHTDVKDIYIVRHGDLA